VWGSVLQCEAVCCSVVRNNRAVTRLHAASGGAVSECCSLSLSLWDPQRNFSSLSLFLSLSKRTQRLHGWIYKRVLFLLWVIMSRFLMSHVSLPHRHDRSSARISRLSQDSHLSESSVSHTQAWPQQHADSAHTCAMSWMSHVPQLSESCLSLAHRHDRSSTQNLRIPQRIHGWVTSHISERVMSLSLSHRYDRSSTRTLHIPLCCHVWVTSHISEWVMSLYDTQVWPQQHADSTHTHTHTHTSANSCTNHVPLLSESCLSLTHRHDRSSTQTLHIPVRCHEWVTSHNWVSHVSLSHTGMDEPRYLCNVMNESRPTSKSCLSHTHRHDRGSTQNLHVPLRIHERVTSHIWVSHVSLSHTQVWPQ